MAESYTTPHTLPLQGTADLVRSPSGDNIRKQLNALSVAANNAITNEGARAEGAAKWFRGNLPNGTNLNTFSESGRWAVRTSADAATMTNGPTGASAGFVELTTADNGMKVQSWTNYGSNKGWRRTTDSITSSTFTPWGVVDVDAKAYADTKDTANRSAWAAADTSKLAEAKSYADSGLSADRARLTSLEAVSPKVSNIALDTDGNPYYSPGSTQVHVIQDGDGEPYYITFLQASADEDGAPYF